MKDLALFRACHFSRQPLRKGVSIDANPSDALDGFGLFDIHNLIGRRITASVHVRF